MKRSVSAMRTLCFLAATMLAGTAAAQLPGQCVVDQDCQDTSYCNGFEHCQPGDPRANKRGCVTMSPACGSRQICHEETDRCETLRTDADGDGHHSQQTGGDDCNDADGNEFPGNAEVWDPTDHDEDCIPSTHGFTPGFGDVARTGRFQACSGRDLVVLQGTVGGEARFSEATCGPGTVCVPQPSGDGYCMAEPTGYVAPAVLGGPRGDQVMRPAASTATATAVAAPRPALPLAMSKPAVAMPPPAPSPALAAPACAPPAVRDANGACALPPGTCPDGQLYDAKSKACRAK